MAEAEVHDPEWQTSPEAAAEGSSRSGKWKMYVFFYDKAVKSAAKSLEAGRPIFVNKIMVKKMPSGDSRLVIDDYARPTDFDEYPTEFARYQQKKENRPDGTPLAAWPVLNDLQQAEFRALNIFTVEQFANLPDEAANRIMGFNELRKKARAFVLAQEAGEKLVAMEEQAKAAAAKEAEQARVIAELTERLAALEASGSGRPTLHAKKA